MGCCCPTAARPSVLTAGRSHSGAAPPRLPHGRPLACPASPLRPIASLPQQCLSGEAPAAAALLQHRPQFGAVFGAELLGEVFLSTHRLWLKMGFNRARCWYLRSKKWPMASPWALTFTISGSSGCPVGSGEPAPLSCGALGVSDCPSPGATPPMVGAGEPRR